MIDKNSPLPLYHQIKQDIKDKINAKRFEVGSSIPSEVDLIAKYGVSRITVRLAIEELEKEGYVQKIQGKGTFVKRHKITQQLNSITSWTETMKAQGKNPITSKLHTAEVAADEALADIMHIKEGTPLYYIERVRDTDGTPTAIMKQYVVAAMAPNLLDAPGLKDSIYAVLENKYKLELDSAVEVVEAHATDSLEASLLQIKIGDPIISVKRITYDPMHSTIEFSENNTKADSYAYEVVLHGRTRAK